MVAAERAVPLRFLLLLSAAEPGTTPGHVFRLKDTGEVTLP